MFLVQRGSLEDVVLVLEEKLEQSTRRDAPLETGLLEGLESKNRLCDLIGQNERCTHRLARGACS